jgi:hypothetical protein
VARLGILHFAVALTGATALPLAAETPAINGFVGAEARSFLNFGGTPRDIFSLEAELRARGTLSDSLSYDLRLYARQNLDGLGGGYVDPTVAKLTWRHDSWQVDLGYDLLFWGVAEGRNLVNVVNQRDQVRDLFNDQGLGQAMLALRYFGEAATIEAFVLPRFEELDFGPAGRPWGLGLPVAGHRATFEAPEGRDHVDLALRVSGQWSNLEYGVFAFDGTLRAPEFRFDPSTSSLVPHYIQGRQVGVAAQYTAGPALLKFEGVETRPDSATSYWSTIVGVEYLVGDVFGKPWETSLFAEHYHDSRQNDPTVAFQNDVFLGTQVRFSNALDTVLELGAIVDLDHGGMIGSAGLSSRLSVASMWMYSALARRLLVSRDTLFNARDDDQISFGLQWHF